jgi:hypothetical protein
MIGAGVCGAYQRSGDRVRPLSFSADSGERFGVLSVGGEKPLCGSSEISTQMVKHSART